MALLRGRYRAISSSGVVSTSCGLCVVASFRNRTCGLRAWHHPIITFFNNLEWAQRKAERTLISLVTSGSHAKVGGSRSLAEFHQ